MRADRKLHLVVGFGLGIVLEACAHGWLQQPDLVRAGAALAGVVAFATGKELIDRFIRRTEFDPVDLLATVAGGVPGVLLCALALRTW